MFIRPVTNRMVRDPITRQHLPEGGAQVPDSPYWRRRIRAGDVVVTTPPRPAPKASIPSPSPLQAKPAPKGKE